MVTFSVNSGRAVTGVEILECKMIKLAEVFYIEGLKGNFISSNQLFDVCKKGFINRHKGKVV